MQPPTDLHHHVAATHASRPALQFVAASPLDEVNAVSFGACRLPVTRNSTRSPLRTAHPHACYPFLSVHSKPHSVFTLPCFSRAGPACDDPTLPPFPFPSSFILSPVLFASLWSCFHCPFVVRVARQGVLSISLCVYDTIPIYRRLPSVFHNLLGVCRKATEGLCLGLGLLGAKAK